MEMNIQKYMSFVKTVEYGSFTKASEILNYSQSGISRMIGDLEKEWNMCLLERDHSGVKPTSDGLRLLPFAKKLCDDFDRLQMEADNLNDLSSGIIRIGTFSSVATYWLPNIIMEFKKDYPNIEYELLIGVILFSLKISEISVFLSFSSSIKGSFERSFKGILSYFRSGCLFGSIARKASSSRKIVSIPGEAGRQIKPQSTRPSVIQLSISS